jgi:signal transduction histidine kinase
MQPMQESRHVLTGPAARPRSRPSILRRRRAGRPETDARAALRRYVQVVLSPGSTPGDLRFPARFAITAAQRLAVDVLLAAGGFVAAVAGPHPPDLEAVVPPRGLAGLVLLAVATAPVAVRRRWPVPVLAVVTVAVGMLLACGRSPLILDLMIGVAAYTVAAQLDRPQSVPAFAGTVALLGGALAVAVTHGVAGNDGLHTVAAASAAWFIGDSVRARRKYLAGLIAQAAERQRAEADEHRQAVRSERMRIAREVHDVVAHTLAVMTVQAGVGRRLLGQRPGEARRTLETIETTGRVAQDELRLVLGLLRDESCAEAELTPAPCLGDLAGLIEAVRAAGTPVDFQVSGPAVELSPAMELSVFRIIQEALTNVVKHAGAAHATVGLALSRRGVRIEVADDGGAAVSKPRHPAGTRIAAPGGQAGSPHGILGMRERVAAFGGSLIAEHRPGTGFFVVAWLPLLGAL